MADQVAATKIETPSPGNWPGTLNAYRLVKPYVKLHIWDFVSAIGLTLVVILVADIIIAILFKHSFTATVLNEIVSLGVGALYTIVAAMMYFKSLKSDEFTLNDVLTNAYPRFLKMLGLILVMYILLVVSFVFFIIPFFIVLPRLYLAPYFLIYNDSSVSQAIAASWHLTKGHSFEIYGILLFGVAIALVAITIIGIPFAVYWFTINSGSFALMTMYLSQPKSSQTNTPSISPTTPV